MHKTALFITIFFLLLKYASYGQVVEDITIFADNISYSEDGSTLEASGSVEVSSYDIKVRGNHIICNVKEKRVIADIGFEMELMNGAKLRGGYLDYSFKTKKGFTKNVNINYRHSVITGGSAIFDEEKIEFKNSSFNTCGLEPPHYHVSSYSTTLYPDEGWVLGYYGSLWVGNVPIVPVPVYLYDLSAYGVGKKTDAGSAVSMPQMGSNDEDGFYIIYKIPWIANRKMFGSVVLFNTAKGGFGEGVETNYIFNDNNDTNFRVFYDRRYDTYGGITHNYRFGPEIGKYQKPLYQFLRIKERLMFELSTNISYKEKVNYERVSMLPELTLRVNDFPALMENVSIGGSIANGYITEETSGAYDSRGILETHGNYELPTDIGRLNLGLAYSQSSYGMTSKWTRMTQNIKLSRDNDFNFDSYVGHMHYINFDGQSPFRYEMYLVAPSDEFSVGVGYNFGSNRFGIDYSWFVPSWDSREFIYSLSMGFHCYTVDIKYSTAMKAFMLGASLITW